MALPIFQVDYSPIYSAFNSLRGAKGTQLAEKHRKQDVGTATLGFVLEGGEMVVEMIVAAVTGMKLSEAKAGTMAFDQRIQAEARKVVLNNDYEIISQEPRDIGIEEGAKLEGKPYRSFKLGGDFESLFNARQQEIEQKYKMFPKIKDWALDQLYSGYTSAKRVAEDTLFSQSIRETAAIDQQSITHSLDQAIRFERFGLVDAALSGSQSLTPDIKNAMRGDLLKQYDLGIRGKRLRETVGAEGYAAGMDLISSWEGAGEVNEEQAENFRKVTRGAAGQVASTFQDKATIQFYEQITGGKDPEAAMQSVLQAVPMHIRGQVEKDVRADYNERLRIEDDKADKEMLIVHNERPKSGTAIRQALRDPKNNYVAEMTTGTYTFWENMADRLDAENEAIRIGRAEEISARDEGYLDEILRTPLKTKEWKIARIQEAAAMKDEKGNFLFDRKTIDWFYTQAHDDKWQQPEVRAPYDRAMKLFDALEKKGQPNVAQKRAIFRETYQTRMDALFQRTQRPTARDLEDLADSILNEDKKSLLPLPIDQLDNLGRRTRIAQLYVKAEEKALQPEEQAAMADYTTKMLQELYGISTAEGERQILETATDGRGRPMFRVTGLYPGNKKMPLWVHLKPDEKGNLQLEHQDRTGNWVETPIQTVAQIETERKRAEKARSRAVQDQVTRAALQVQTIADVAAQAKAIGVSEEEIGIAALGAEGATGSFGDITARLEVLLEKQLRQRVASEEDVREAANRSAVKEAAVYGFLLRRGVQIIRETRGVKAK